MGGRRVGTPAPRFEGFSPSSKRASTTAKAVRRTDGRAEVALRKALWTLGLRYRKNVTTLPGKPDIVFQKMRVAIFIDGDFWHGRDWDARLAKLRRGSNAPYWVAKINANMERDKRKTAELQADGWTVLRVWETDVVRAPSEVAERIASGWLRGLGIPAENSRGRPGSK